MAEGSASNIRIDLTTLAGWEITFKGETLHITGEEIFKALRSHP